MTAFSYEVESDAQFGRGCQDMFIRYRPDKIIGYEKRESWL